MTVLDNGSEIHPGEVALGVLRGDAAKVATDRVEGDRDFARDVAWWQMMLAQLGAALPPIAPPDALRAAIAERIDGPARPAASTRQRAWVWPAIAAGLGAVALGEFVMLVSRPTAPVIERAAKPGETFFAVLAPAEGPAPILVNLDLPQGLLTVDPSGLEAGDRAVQLWLLPAGGAPVSLGLLAPNQDNTVQVPVSMTSMSADGLPGLAISLEPVGGSPTGTPTGPVVASGQVRVIDGALQ